MSIKDKIGFLIVIMITLSSCSFFNPFGLISTGLSKFLFYLFSIIGWFWAWKKCPRCNTYYPRITVNMIMIGIFSSVFMASVFHEQNFSISLITTLPAILAYAFFPLLMRLQIPKEKIELMIKLLVIMSIIVYIANAITFPDCVFRSSEEAEKEIDISRGLPRLGIAFIIFYVFLFLKNINEMSQKNITLNLFAKILILTLFIILSLTRQIIATSLALGLLLILHKATLIKKICVSVFVSIFMLCILPQIPIYNAMKELSEYQAARNDYIDEDIRIKAWKFYTYENQTNLLSPIFGNGTPSIGNSPWGNKFEKEIYPEYGGNACYAADVGWAGFFWYYGVVSTIGLLLLLAKTLFIKKKRDETFIGYWFLFIIITSIASGAIVYHFQIISICTILYLAYGPNPLNCETDY